MEGVQQGPVLVEIYFSVPPPPTSSPPLGPPPRPYTGRLAGPTEPHQGMDGDSGRTIPTGADA